MCGGGFLKFSNIEVDLEERITLTHNGYRYISGFYFNIYLKLFLFMKKQFDSYEIEDATILFENEDILQEYNRNIAELDKCTEITVKQTELRAKVLKEYTSLIN